MTEEERNVQQCSRIVDDVADEKAFDVVMVMLEKTWCTRSVLEGVSKHYSPRAIHIVTPEVSKQELSACMGDWATAPVHIHGEEHFFPGMGREDIYGEMAEQRGLYKLGWFYQQILKLGADEGIPGLSEWFLVWDADMVPFDAWPVEDDGKHKFALVQHKASGNPVIVGQWYEWIRKILGVEVVADTEATFVPHHFWFKREHLASFRAQLRQYFSSDDHWAILMMRSVKKFETFSEYWSYASWVAKQRPEDLAFHPYAAYGERNERFFDNGIDGIFSKVLRESIQRQQGQHKASTPCPDNEDEDQQPFSPSYEEIFRFTADVYAMWEKPLPSSFNFEQSGRHLQKMEKNMHLEEQRALWNPRVTQVEDVRMKLWGS